MKKSLKLSIATILVAIAALLGYQFDVFDLGAKFTTQQIHLTYDFVSTSSPITTYNSMEIGTSTPTSTEYFVLGNEIDQVDMFLWAQATSTDNKVLEWKVYYSPVAGVPSSSIDFYSEDSSAISSSLVTHAATEIYHRWTLAGTSAYQKKITICSPAPDGTDDINLCNAGWYKIEIGRPDGMSAYEVYMSVVGKQF